MKANLIALGFIVPALALAAQSTGDYPITVHVGSSEIFSECSQACTWYLPLHVTVDGKKITLQHEHLRKDLLWAGAYKAKIVNDETKKPYEYSKEYEFLLPDGEKRKYLVTSESE